MSYKKQLPKKGDTVYTTDGRRIMFNNAYWELPAEEQAEKCIDFYETFEENEE